MNRIKRLSCTVVGPNTMMTTLRSKVLCTALVVVAVAAVAVVWVVPPTSTMDETTAVAEMLCSSKNCRYKYRYINLYHLSE